MNGGLARITIPDLEGGRRLRWGRGLKTFKVDGI